MSQALARAWYEGRAWPLLLAPLSLLFALVTALRHVLYRSGLLRVTHLPVPVIVVGNISVGGTGKTPLTEALVTALRARGFHPGVVSRGYGGRAPYHPLRLTPDMGPEVVGDEPAMLFRRTGVPLVVDPLRARGAAHLLASGDCDVILCDDGLQHLALARDIEIAVVDGARGFGNGWLLPAGPLREPVRRLHSVDHVVVNGEGAPWPDALRMRLVAQPWQPLTPDSGGVPPAPGSRVHAVAGIGNPGRFFDMMRAQGFDVVEHAFPDHHVYTAADLAFNDTLPVVMTEKDGVKCRTLSCSRGWVVPVRAELPAEFLDRLTGQISALARMKTNAG
ncbi:MAG TPA: tetraacyldisaccharide 4'-kinase [Moraxellaceae bacterium]|nr:tetraacyldisaccharide 4'-kinase [Moraxellaceae bacterium]